jgi:hypothetical protein
VFTKPPKLNVTKDYRLFHRPDDADNRDAAPKRWKRLRASMQRYGFLPDRPISCYRDATKTLWVKDGQHRLIFAEELALPVYWIETPVDYDVGIVGATGEKWLPIDHARRYAARGNPHYRAVLALHTDFGISPNTAAGLLAGQTSGSNVSRAFEDGTYEATDQTFGITVATLYRSIYTKHPTLKHNCLLMALAACCRAPLFDAGRLLQNLTRCRAKVAEYSTRDAFLDMLEEIYNYGRHELYPLKIAAMQAMKERQPTHARKKPSELEKARATISRLMLLDTTPPERTSKQPAT